MEIINLNGEEYIKRSRVSELEKKLEQSEKDLITIKKIIGQSFENLVPLLGIEKKSVTQDTFSVKKTTTTKTSKPRTTYKDNQLFEVCDSAKLPWKIDRMDKDGNFYFKDNRKLEVTLKDVLEVRKELTMKTTHGEVKQLWKRLGLTHYMINRLIFNIQNHTFDRFIQEWNSFARPKTGMKNLPVENNPEKRKEAGIYGI